MTDLTFLNGHNKAKFILSTNEQLEIAAAAVDDENAAVAMDEDQTASASEA